jgi:exodeoxyribonuclease-5
MTGKPDPGLVCGTDQILVGRNSTRRGSNLRMRGLLGRSTQDDLPIPGDRLVCLRNDYQEGLLNGTIWEVKATAIIDNTERLDLTVINEEGVEITVESHKHYFQGRGEEIPFYEIREAQCFDYGYALTTHKAQGSQWGSVFIFDESWVFRASARQWLYTAITRAAERVVVCRN